MKAFTFTLCRIQIWGELPPTSSQFKACQPPRRLYQSRHHIRNLRSFSLLSTPRVFQDSTSVSRASAFVRYVQAHWVPDSRGNTPWGGNAV
ncbi:hypothetical protein CPB84DRAFT_1780243 [Gymnopilus junonius]|uniref:Uncharacterized protein n=1 Tax=Gymnopilus junonius TaxID=109634 RepID=A0A9P5TMK4_GYMJU|nr:hypothetical protein CPB84DRAFT_1780243 [Gymnopilus junonius]